MDRARFLIRVSAAGGPPHALWVDGPSCVVGRSRAAQIRLPAPEVSGAHLRLLHRDGGLWVEDLGSANGTLLAGERLPPGSPQPLPEGAVLTLGPYAVTASIRDGATRAEDLAEGTATLAARLLEDLVAAGAAPPAFVEITTPDGVSQRSVLTPGRGLRIGRDPGCDVGAADPDLSRAHLALRLETEGAVAEDLGSKNGTWRGEVRLVGRTRLRSGDVLRLGGTTLRFEDPAEAWLAALEAEVPPLDEPTPAATPATETPPEATGAEGSPTGSQPPRTRPAGTPLSGASAEDAGAAATKAPHGDAPREGPTEARPGADERVRPARPEPGRPRGLGAPLLLVLCAAVMAAALWALYRLFL